PIILGMALKDKKGYDVTLRDCFLSKHGYSSHSLADGQEFFAPRAFFGAHFTGDSDFVFSTSSVSFSGLAAWATGLTGFAGHAVQMKMAWSPPPPLNGKIDNGTFSLGVGCTSSEESRKRTLAERVSLDFSFPAGISEDELTAKIYPFQNLFTFACDVPN